MPTLGSDGGFQADNRGGIIDDQGNTIVTSDTSFAASPLGVAARTQALYGIPNANFNLTPPDPDSPIVANQNDLPYWSIEDLSDGQITATTVFDDATQTYGVELNPGTAATSSSLTLSTRSYILTDDNLALRQKALSVISKSGTAGGTASQWNLQLSAIYYDANDTALSTAVIGTALDTGTWTSFSGTTTPGGSAINSAAQYVDLTYTLATTAAVTGSVKATIKSLLLTTTSPTTGGGLLVTEMFTSGATWTKPTGVDYLVAALVVGAGGGGGGGGIASGTSANGTAVASGGSGGGGGGWVFVQNLYVPDASYSIGIGASGTGGTAAQQYLKVSGSAHAAVARIGGNGAAGGASTFGTIITSAGGGGGLGGTANTTGSTTTAVPVGGTAGATTVSIYGAEPYVGGTGGGRTAGTLGTTTQVSSAPFTFDIYPYTSTPSNAATGGSASADATGSPTGTGTASSGAIGFCGGGASGQRVGAVYGGIDIQDVRISPMQNAGGNGGGGGAGASAGFVRQSNSGTNYARAGAGGNAASNSGGGGGGGGGAAIRTAGSGTAGEFEATAAAGGNGSSGYVIIAYVA